MLRVEYITSKHFYFLIISIVFPNKGVLFITTYQLDIKMFITIIYLFA